MQINNNVQRGQLATLLLSCLLECDMYGKELLQNIEEKTAGQLSIKQPTLYSSLSRLEKQNLISSYWRDGETGGKRHYYSITDLGKKMLLDSDLTIFANNDENLEEISPNIEEKVQKSLIKQGITQKYDEIEGFNKNNEVGIVKKNEITNSAPKKPYISSPCHIENDIKTLNTTRNSFSQQISKQDFSILDGSQNQPNSFLINESYETDKFPSKNYETQNNKLDSTQINVDLQNDQNINLEQDNISIHTNTNYQTNNLANNENNPIIENASNDNTNTIKDDAVFINEHIDDSITKVKKLHYTELEIADNSFNDKLKIENKQTGFNEKINNLYNIAKPKQNDNVYEDYISQYPTLNELHNRYDDMNIKFYSTAKPIPYIDEKKENKTVPGKALLFKFSILFILASIIAGLTYTILYCCGISVQYDFLFFVLPAIFIVPCVIFLVLKNKYFSLPLEKSSWLTPLIFLVGVVLIYAINMLWGLGFNNILNYSSTFILPSALLLTLFASAFIDSKLYKKYKK